MNKKTLPLLSLVEVFVPPCVSTPEFIHAAMRPDVITETVVEVSTEESEPMDTSPIPTSPEIHEPMKKKKGTGSRTVGTSNKQQNFWVLLKCLYAAFLGQAVSGCWQQ